MIKKSRLIYFVSAATIAFFTSIFGVYQTIKLPKPETVKAMVDYFFEDPNSYSITFLIVFISVIACVITVVLGTISIIEFIRGDEYSYSYYDSFEIGKRSLIAILLISLLCLCFLIFYMIKYLILLLVAPLMLILIIKALSD